MKLTKLVDQIRLMDGYDVDNLTHINYEHIRLLLYDFYLHGCLVGNSTRYSKDDIDPEFEKKFNKLMT